MKQNQFEEHLTECMGVPTVEAFEIYKESANYMNHNVDGMVHDYDDRLMKECIAEAKNRGYKEVVDGDA